MITHTRRETIDDVRIPKGYSVVRAENRGYDSPDRWFEATCRGRRIGGDFGTREGAITFCVEHAKP